MLHHLNVDFIIQKSTVQSSEKLQHNAKYRNTPQHTATSCNTLQHLLHHINVVVIVNNSTVQHSNRLQNTAKHCKTLQTAATHYNTLQHTATCCNMLLYHMSLLLYKKKEHRTTQ